MRIIFFGLGSIGQRHAKLICTYYPDFELYAFRTEKGQQELSVDLATSITPVGWEDIEEIKPDVAFICNPTFLHVPTAIRCAELGMHLFIEKPISHNTEGLERLIGLVSCKNLTAYVAYPLRHHPKTKSLGIELWGKKILHARFVCTSYLPWWRPGADHTKCYSAHRDQGGGPLLDMSHQLDLAVHLFGPIKGIEGKWGRAANVTVDADDYADLIITHKSGMVSNIHINFFSKRAQDYVEVETEDIVARADFTDPELMNEAYVNQLRYFFEFGSPKMDNNLLEASWLFRTIVDLMKGGTHV